MFIVTFLASVIFGYTAFVTVYLFFFAAAGKLRRLPASPAAATNRRIAVLVPGYKEDAVILEAAWHGLQQDYPQSMYDMVVIADSFSAATIQALRAMPIRLIEVVFDKSTKAKALNVALQQLTDSYDIAVILDADNLMAPDFLRQVNNAFAQGWQVLQGHRTAKNTNTSVAVLDAISEEINNHIFRQGHRAVGLSAALIGSGMAFDYRLLKMIMPEVQAMGGFDKELEMRLLSKRMSFGYLPDAYVYDEKVQNEAVFERQRTRWIAAQFKYLRLNFWPGLKALMTGNIDYADKVFQTMLPPRILLLGSLGLGAVASGLAGNPFFFPFIAGQFVLLLLTFYLSAPATLIGKIGLDELLKLPILFASFLKSMYKMKAAKGQFLHTPHGTDKP